MIILDTNVVSEAMKPVPDTEVLRWLGNQAASQLFLTSITQAEILYGLELLPKGRRRTRLESAIEAMLEEDFAGRILPFDSDAARVFAGVIAARRALGRPMAQSDAQIAAIALSQGATLATRNIADFKHCGVTLVNAWRVQ